MLSITSFEEHNNILISHVGLGGIPIHHKYTSRFNRINKIIIKKWLCIIHIVLSYSRREPHESFCTIFYIAYRIIIIIIITISTYVRMYKILFRS